MGELIPRPEGRPQRTVLGLLVGLSLLLGAAACAPSASEPGTPTAAVTPTPTAATAAAERAEHIDGEDVTHAPRPVDGTALLSAADRSGGATLPIPGRIAAGRLAIQVTCRGDGELTVALTPGTMQFPLTCLDRETSSTYNEIHLKQPRDGAALRITAPAGVRWAVTAEQ